MKTLHIAETHQRREQATDKRGVPASYARAMKGFDQSCTHCSQRALVVDGGGRGLCAEHRAEKRAAIQARERIWRRLKAAQRAKV